MAGACFGCLWIGALDVVDMANMDIMSWQTILWLTDGCGVALVVVLWIWMDTVVVVLWI